jgi:Ca2+-transporting ATPase
VFSQMALALCVRSESNPLFRLRLSANPFLLLALLVTVVLQLAVVYAPPLQALFHTRPLGPWELAAVFGITVVVFAAVEVLEKLLVKRAR